MCGRYAIDPRKLERLVKAFCLCLCLCLCRCRTFASLQCKSWTRHCILNDQLRCITAHSLAMFLPQIGDSVQQVQLAGALACRLYLDETAHCDSQQTHGRTLGNCPIQ